MLHVQRQLYLGTKKIENLVEINLQEERERQLCNHGAKISFDEMHRIVGFGGAIVLDATMPAFVIMTFSRFYVGLLRNALTIVVTSLSNQKQ